MPIISGAIAAVAAAATAVSAAAAGAATVGAAVSAVATAAVSVSTVVGVAGMAVTAVGAITKNKDLLSAGKIMGYVGMGSALGGGLLGGASTFFEGGASSFMEGVKGAFTGAADQISKSWDEGIGSWFSPEAGSATKAVGQVDAVKPGLEANGPQMNPELVNPPPQPTPTTGQSFDAWKEGIKQQELGQRAVRATQDNLGAMQAQNGIAPAPTIATGGETALKGVENVANFGPGSTANQLATNPALGTVMGGAPTAAPKAPGLLSSMPEWAKYAALTSGAQGLTGLAAGYFQGLSADDQLEFQKLMNQQNQQQQQYQNQNNDYRNILSFRH